MKVPSAILLLLLLGQETLTSSRNLQGQQAPRYKNVQSGMVMNRNTFGVGKFEVELNPPDVYGTSQVFGLGF
jgi:hypothetical protein